MLDPDHYAEAFAERNVPSSTCSECGEKFWPDHPCACMRDTLPDLAPSAIDGAIRIANMALHFARGGLLVAYDDPAVKGAG